MRSSLCLIFSLFAVPFCLGQSHSLLSPAESQALVSRAVKNELQASNSQSRPMRYLLRKSSSNRTTTKEIFESKDGAVARLIAIDDKPLSAEEEQQEQARLDTLLSNPSLQRRRQKSQESDLEIVSKVLRLLPSAFLYQDVGPTPGPSGPVEKFSFRPNPAFHPPDLETQALTSMAGLIQIDPAQERLFRLEGRLLQDTNYGWGVLGKLNKGGAIEIDQTELGDRHWRIVRLKLKMNLRVVWKNKALDTVEEMSQYRPVPVGVDYKQAIQILSSESAPAARALR